GPPLGRGAVRRGPEAAVADPAGERGGGHLADRRRLEGCLQRAGPALAARPRRARRLQGAGRGLGREHRHRAPPRRAPRRSADQREDRLAAARPVVVTRRLGQARAGLDSALSALAVLGPNATLERGYAIVRRVDDGAIVRDPVAAPVGTGLAVRVARGEFPAT